MKTKKLFRRTITVFLSAVMLLASVPGSAAAAGASAVPERPETLSASKPSPEPSSDGLYSRRITVDLDKLADIVTRDYSEEAIRRVDSENIVFVTDYEWAQKAGEALFSEAGKEDVLTVVSDNGTETVRYTLVNGDAVAQDAYNSAVWLKEDGSELPVGEKPERPGIYRLKFSLPGSDTSTAAENTDIILRVDKTGLGVYSGKDESENDKLVRTVKAGTPYAGLTEANKDFWLSTLRFPKITKDSAPSRDALLNMAATEIKIGTREEDGSFRPITDEKDTVFRKDRIYVLIFDLVLKEDADDLYYVEPEDTVFYVAVGDKTETFMDFEYIDSALGTGLVRNYDGKEVTPSDILSVVSSSKLCYMDGDNKVVIKEDVAGTIDQDPDLTGFWVYSDGVTPLPLSANVVSAGTYFYKIVFHDDTAAYGSSEELIRLVINPVNAVVTPVYEPFEAPDDGGEKEINEGTTAKEIIKDVTYRLTDSSGKDITDEIDRRYFWGTAYNYDEGTSHEGYEVHTGQSYEPLFVLQEIKTEEGRDPVIRELSPSDAITADPSVSYRIVFSGDKAVFDADGNYSSRNSINSTSQDVDENSYRIDTGEDTRYAKANIVEFKVRPGTPVSIDLSGIVAGKGKSLPEGSLFSKPVESEYDQAPLFTEKKDYRKATVSAGGEEIAADVSDFKYTWEMFDGEKLSTVLWSGPVRLERRIDAFMDRDGLVFDPPETDPDWPPDSASEEEWEDYHRKHAAFLVWNDKPGGDWQVDGKFTWNEIHGETSYDEELNGTWHGFDDPDAHWAAPSNPGIYRLKVTYHDPAHVNKDAAAYVYFVIHRIKAAAQIEGSPVSYADGLTTAGLVLDLLQGRDPSNSDQYCGITLTALNTASENRLPVPGSIRKRIAASPGAFLRVQKKTVSEGQTVWVSVDNPYDEVIKASEEYRLRFDPDSIKDETGLYLETYYNFYGDRTGTHDQLLNNVSTEAYGGTVPLTVRGSQAKPVEITVDDSRFSYGKVFDETGISLSDLEISTVSGTTELDLPLRYIVRWVDKGIDYNDPSLAVHAGEYRITIVCPATAEYAMAAKELGKSYRITKKKIKAVPTLKNPVFAGMNLDVSDFTVISQNLIESWEMEGFPGGADEFYLFDDYLEWIVLVFRSGIKQEMVADNRYSGLLTSGDEYFVTLDESEAAGANDPEFIRSRSDDFGSDISYGLDYEVRAEMKTFVPVMDHALISAAEVDGSWKEYMQIQASYSHDPGAYEWTDLITAPAGVPFDYDSHRHFLVFDIHRPAEFGQGGRNKSFNKGGDFAFRENIEKAVKAYGGDPEKEDVITLKDDHITVRLDADLICKTESKKVSFDIIWDAGTNYSEHFVADLSDAQLFADLGEAVCPRSLSIVSDSRQMAVGDTGQLDVRIKKNQNSDLILLAYESDNPDVLNVTGGLEDVLKEDQTGNNFHGAGFLTALKPGKATITAWPCRMVYDAKTGKTFKEKLKDGKPASVKITVTDVEAVKLGKIIPHDDKVVFTYRMPQNGFRREAYILPGKISQAVFENRIREVKNGDYSAFTSVRLGLTEMSFDKASGRYVKALPKSEVSRDGDELPLALGDLKPDTQYTLYLRNVSGIRS
ncbi:MAG: hypothetical protein IJT00_10015, partial [Lachnospiraceae bacterium]|nr:hypothetical protein [Lachnospiraceae bacterium]